MRSLRASLVPPQQIAPAPSNPFFIVARALRKAVVLAIFAVLTTLLVNPLCRPSFFSASSPVLVQHTFTRASPRLLHRQTAFVALPHRIATVVAPSASKESDTASSSVEKVRVRHSLVGVATVMFIVGAALASAETAITTLWPWKVRELAEKEGDSSPFSALESDLTRFLTTILVTTTSATVLSTAIATEVAGDFFGPAAVGYVTAGMTVFFLFFGEILPKALAVHAPAKVARIMVPVISLLSVIVYPVGKLLAWISTQILRILKLPMESDATVSEEELRLIVAGADQSGSIEKYESQIIQNVLDLEETDVSEVMCPRVDIVALAATRSLEELLKMESESHYSRMPVYDGTIDNIVGVAMVKSLLRYLSADPTLLQTTQVSEIMDPAFYVPESMSVWIVLEEMRKRRLHMAIVVDEYGGTAGLVTLEDILEEVVGEIYDEDDDYEADAQIIEKGEDGLYRIEGQTVLKKVDEALSLNLEEEDLDDYGTISGFLCARMGGIPDIGDHFVFNRVQFTVIDADDRRIISLRAETLTREQMSEIVADIESLQDENLEFSQLNGGKVKNGLDGDSQSREDAIPNTHSSGNGQASEFGSGKSDSGFVATDLFFTEERGAVGEEDSTHTSNQVQPTDVNEGKQSKS